MYARHVLDLLLNYLDQKGHLYFLFIGRLDLLQSIERLGAAPEVDAWRGSVSICRN